MSDILFQETDAATGVTLKIIADHDLESPLTYQDDSIRFAVLHRRYDNPAEDHDLCTPEEIAEFMQANAADDAEWACFALFLYDHSGTVYAASQSGMNPFSCQWDSGRVGMIALKRSEFATHGQAKSEGLFGVAKNICESYTDYANGYGAGYVIEDEDGEELDSSWGFLGNWEREGGALAEGQRAATPYIRDALAALASDAEASRPDLYTPAGAPL